jgi:hypothetical protein
MVLRAVVLSAVVVCLVGTWSPAQDKKKPLTGKALTAALEVAVNTDAIIGPMSLKDALAMLSDYLAAKGKPVAIKIDEAQFKRENVDAGSPLTAEVRVPRFARVLSVGSLLYVFAQQVPTRNAALVLRPDHVLVTTAERSVELLQTGAAGRYVPPSGKAVNEALKLAVRSADYQVALSLQDALQTLTDQLKAKGKSLAIVVNVSAFSDEDPEGSPLDAKVVLPKTALKELPVAKLLGTLLTQVPTKNATFVVRSDFVEVTTMRRARAQ